MAAVAVSTVAFATIRRKHYERTLFSTEYITMSDELDETELECLSSVYKFPVQI